MNFFAKRNRKIKSLLAKKYGKSVRVRGGRGTAAGWVYIFIYVDPPLTKEKKMKVYEEIHKILKEAQIYEEIGTYYDDFNYEHKTILIHVREKAK